MENPGLISTENVQKKDIFKINSIIHLYVYMYVCFWPQVSIPFSNYEVAGFHHQEVDITNLDSAHLPGYIFIPPYIKDKFH